MGIGRGLTCLLGLGQQVPMLRLALGGNGSSQPYLLLCSMWAVPSPLLLTCLVYVSGRHNLKVAILVRMLQAKCNMAFPMPTGLAHHHY